MKALQRTLALSVLLVWALNSNCGAQSLRSKAAPSIAVELCPAAPDAAQRIPWIDLALTLRGPSVAVGHSLFKMPLVAVNVLTAARTIENLSASDSRGPLQLKAMDDPGAAPMQYRHWSASRPTSGDVTVHYRVPISDVLAPLGAAPPLELRSDSGAFSGEGSTFLLLPESSLPYQLTVRWDFQHMGPTATGITTLGAGDLTSKTATGVDALGSSFFMAGAIHVYPDPPPPVGFFSAWYGHPPFDLLPVMTSERHLYHYYEQFFHRPTTQPYGVFLRENLVNAGGGVSLGNTSFVTTFGPETSLDDVTITLAHEMLHTFVGGLGGPEGEANSWYAEGLAVYYARLLALRDGQITPAQFLDNLNTIAGRYYTDIMIHTPNAEITSKFWLDTRIRVLPYDRGSMYFALLDHELRTATRNRVSLDTLVLAMLDKRAHGLPLTTAVWRDLLRHYLGQAGVDQFDSMLAGATMLPPANAFGPCFTRVLKPLRRYELGFDPKVLTERNRVVAGLIPGSAAALAGVRNGDVILKPVPQDLIQGQQDGILTLDVLRAGKEFEVHYLPRAETVEAYQWARVPGVSDKACAY